MRTTIDGAGRVVVPKPLRAALGLQAGTPLEISEYGGNILIEPVPAPMHLVRTDLGLVIEPDVELPPLTPEQVRATLESVRR